MCLWNQNVVFLEDNSQYTHKECQRTRRILTKVPSVPASAIPFFSPALDFQTSSLSTKATLLRRSQWLPADDAGTCLARPGGPLGPPRWWSPGRRGSDGSHPQRWRNEAVGRSRSRSTMAWGAPTRPAPSLGLCSCPCSSPLRTSAGVTSERQTLPSTFTGARLQKVVGTHALIKADRCINCWNHQGGLN